MWLTNQALCCVSHGKRITVWRFGSGRGITLTGL